jgi:rod shape-determining protein MreC
MLILLLTLIFFIAVFGLTLGKRERLTPPERFLKDTVSWTQGLFYKPAGYIAGLFQDVRDLRVVYEENKTLRMTLSQYARDTMRLNVLDNENKRLKDLLAFTERQKSANKYVYHVAEVVAVSPDAYSNEISVNLGASDGIKPNMAVMSVDGLVGRIDKVFEFHSTVQPLPAMDDTDNKSIGIAATVKGKEDNPGSFGIVSFEQKEQKLIMSKIPQPVQKGDTIMTSGLGDVFPSGIEIGTVESVAEDKFGLTYRAVIKPKASFVHLREVLIVEVSGLG